MNNTVKKLARAGLIASLYVVLVVPTISVASGMLQFRLSEALTILPLFFVEAIPALGVGCIVANLITGCSLLDIFCGAIITLLSAVLTRYVARLFKNKWLKFFVGGAFPILLNAFLLPVVWYVAYGELLSLYIVNVACLLLSQSVSIYGVGALLYNGIEKSKLLNN